ncbi:ThiF family adenylyltransferase [Ancylomarina euxinus]|uniref:ThiF family adenylyltransferase n=2 Tax=Ancylomarina euxinus TaxID=2283627 RepID=A0A425Y6F9_9BACT|nr:ThiF family adenylyltransferase [Ancylomarina euxinus]RRG24058.1 ThiF family adenylyltransferase [Ancylomarina euxinus]
MYQRNRIYISSEEQEIIKNTKILIAGAGLGSNIAECVLRMGFENLTICDMDNVENSNLNRQNYTSSDIEKPKVDSLYHRLKSINPEAEINYHNVFLTETNCCEYIENIDIAINTIDFTSDAPFVFDEICRENNIPVLHPFNFGWAGCVFIINKWSESLLNIIQGDDQPEVSIVEHIIQNSKSDVDLFWLRDVLKSYKDENAKNSPPQLAPASWITAGICANLLFKLANNKSIKVFPNFYLLTAN